jgi:hypothetical protein
LSSIAKRQRNRVVQPGIQPSNNPPILIAFLLHPLFFPLAVKTDTAPIFLPSSARDFAAIWQKIGGLVPQNLWHT